MAFLKLFHVFSRPEGNGSSVGRRISGLRSSKGEVRVGAAESEGGEASRSDFARIETETEGILALFF